MVMQICITLYIFVNECWNTLEMDPDLDMYKQFSWNFFRRIEKINFLVLRNFFGNYPIKWGTLLILEGWLNSGYEHILKAYSQTFHLHPKLGLCPN